jgi:hypothetical protein
VDYEDFYHFVQLIKVDSKKNTQIFTNAKNKLFEEHPEFKRENMFSDTYQLPSYGLPVTILNYLIWDLLKISKPEDELLSAYKPFIDLIKGFDEVDIFTLNHDLLVEFLLEKNGLEFTKGFSKDNSEIHYEGHPLPTYKGNYEKFGIRLYKLHGSVDCYRFEHCNVEGASYTPTGDYSYYLPGGYRARHFSVRVNPKTEEVVQDLCFDVVPQFITGKDKRSLIDKDYMYADLYERFTSTLGATDNLFVSGYSFRDEHINEILKNSEITNVVNQNPGEKFPFDKLICHVNYLSDVPGVVKNFQSKRMSGAKK